MRTSLIIAMSLIGAALSPPVYASDHTDEAVLSLDLSADLTDLYAWTSTVEGASYLNVVMGVRGTFSPSILYAAHIESRPSYAATEGVDMPIICRFPRRATIECWGGDQDYLVGTEGLAARSNGWLSEGRPGFTAFAVRDGDLAFFNRPGLEAVRATIDPTGTNICTPVTSSTADALLSELRQDGAGGSATNTYAGESVSFLILQIELDLIDDGGPLLAVWAATYDNAPRGD